MKVQKNTSTNNRCLKLLERTALASASAGANSFCCWILHNPQKPDALKKLKKF